MKRIEILQELTTIFREVFDRSSLVLSEQMTSDDVEQWDSLHHINLIVAVQSSFGLKFRTTEIEKLKNIGDLVTAIEGRIPQSNVG